MAKQRSPKQLAKFIDYILARRPDEFGLVVDAEGFVKIKELLKTLNEEVGWKYVRRSHLDEIVITLKRPSFEILENKIRAKTRDHLPKTTQVQDPPKLLYTCVRRKAYPSVREKGIYPSGQHHVVLSSNHELAQRIGKRMDPSPVMLTVHTQHSAHKGVRYHQAGKALFLSEHIPADCFSGPPLPKEKPPSKKPEMIEGYPARTSAGSYTIDIQEKMRPQVTVSKKYRGEIESQKDR
ncbi:MAG: RNA 2'-phosphotransferase, partial [Desulfobacterales bacterium]